MAAVNITEGRITNHLVRYLAPLILGNLFQLVYNTMDSIIAGRFIGKQALAAEGTASPVMNIVILGISGICMRASVPMSGFFGADRQDKLKGEMSITVIFGCYFSVIVALLGVFFSRPLLKAFQVPEEILGMASTYLSIIFLGTPFAYFYNAVSTTLKSVGDSKTPLKFLTFSSVLNALLDLIFIGGLGFGIVCSATTTVIAEATLAILCITCVYREIPMLQLRKGELAMDRQLPRQTLRYGSVTALQQSCQPIGKLPIQGTVNPLGVDMIAAFNAVSRIDDYAFTPEQSISHGITTFVAQNRGAGKKERIWKDFHHGLTLEPCYWVCIALVILLFRKPLMRLSVTAGNQGIIGLGSSYLGLMALFYIFPAFTNGIQGSPRGMGNMNIILLGTFVQTSLRAVLVYLLAPVMGTQDAAYACTVGWSVMLLVEAPHYFWSMRGKRWGMGSPWGSSWGIYGKSIGSPRGICGKLEKSVEISDGML